MRCARSPHGSFAGGGGEQEGIVGLFVLSSLFAYRLAFHSAMTDVNRRNYFNVFIKAVLREKNKNPDNTIGQKMNK